MNKILAVKSTKERTDLSQSGWNIDSDRQVWHRYSAIRAHFSSLRWFLCTGVWLSQEPDSVPGKRNSTFSGLQLHSRTSLWLNQFSSVAQSCLTLCDPMDCSTPGFPVPHHLPKFAQVHVHWIGDAIAVKYHLTPVKIAFIKKSTNKFWKGCGEKETLLHFWWKCKLTQPLWRTL